MCQPSIDVLMCCHPACILLIDIEKHQKRSNAVAQSIEVTVSDSQFDLPCTDRGRPLQ